MSSTSPSHPPHAAPAPAADAISSARPAPGAPADPKPKSPLVRILIAAFYLALAAACLAAIRHSLGDAGFGGVLAAIRTTHINDIAASAACVAGVFIVWWVMEQAALLRAHAPAAAHAMPLSTLAANAVALGSGFGMLSGGALRTRLYARAGVDATQAWYVASAVTMMSVFGGAVVAGLGLALQPDPHFLSLRWLGWLILAGAALMIALAGRHGRTLTFFGRSIELPGAAELALWLSLGALDWVLSGAALWVLLPEHERAGLPAFSGLFAAAQLIAMPTGAPNGIGVFDAIVLSSATTAITAAKTGAALIAFRAIAFLAPVIIGLGCVALLEATRGKHAAHPLANAPTQRRTSRLTHALLQTFIGKAWPATAHLSKGQLFAEAEQSAPISIDALIGGRALLVLAPHPDDDVLGCGGLIAAATAQGVDVQVVYLTDGSRSHISSPSWTSERLAAERRAEAAGAAAVLGLKPEHLTFLDNRDGALLFNRAARARSVAAIETLMRKHAIGCIMTSWIHDPHPDHVAAALIARAVCKHNPALKLVSYPVDGRTLPDHTILRDRRWRAVRVDVREALAAKRAALAAHRTQVTTLIDDAVLTLRAPDDAPAYLGSSEVYLF